MDPITQPLELKVNFGALMPETLVKVLVVGDKACGKVSLIERFASDKFPIVPSAIVGVKMMTKVIKNAGKPTLRIQFYLIDSSKEELAKMYYREATAGIVLFDVSQKLGLESARKWKEVLDTRSSEFHNIPVMLIGNKSDLPHDPFDKKEMDSFCEENGFVKFIEVSAKTGENIYEPFTSFLSNIDRYLNNNNNNNYIEENIEKIQSFTLSSSTPTTKPVLDVDQPLRGNSCSIM